MHKQQHSARKHWLVLLLIAAVCCPLGIFLIVHGNQLGSQDYTYNVIPWAFWGFFFLSMPLWYVIAVAVAHICRLLGAETRRYQAWKASLDDNQRLVVNMAELGLLSFTAYEAWTAHRRRDARLTERVMGHRGPEPDQGYQPGTAPDPSTAFSQKIISRHHPYHRGTDGAFSPVGYDQDGAN